MLAKVVSPSMIVDRADASERCGIIILGNSGVGKSFLANILFGDEGLVLRELLQLSNFNNSSLCFLNRINPKNQAQRQRLNEQLLKIHLRFLIVFRKRNAFILGVDRIQTIVASQGARNSNIARRTETK
ncbi:unnamed protein product [Adineta ricciae]|uniref:Uncharacterized protein n=1 Tax=Adineta ricciae TaxID=249248 RepID=A0A815IA94_ADIRI|nr:unnamed protein product [Adineta ricciae]CAF1362359.1 unnamed protein product [Adineta ricciae]